MPQDFTPPEYVETYLVIRLVQVDMATPELIAEPLRRSDLRDAASATAETLSF